MCTLTLVPPGPPAHPARVTSCSSPPHWPPPLDALAPLPCRFACADLTCPPCTCPTEAHTPSVGLTHARIHAPPTCVCLRLERLGFGAKCPDSRPTRAAAHDPSTRDLPVLNLSTEPGAFRSRNTPTGLLGQAPLHRCSRLYAMACMSTRCTSRYDSLHAWFDHLHRGPRMPA